MNSAADITGWMDELAVQQLHVLTAHAGIASLAIIVLLVLVAQLLPRDGEAGPENDEV
jgi:hypothetical protein